jgi:hypothetical protein
MKSFLIGLLVFGFLGITTQAVPYQLEAGPWVVNFNSSQKLIDKNENVGSAELIELLDENDNRVGWISLYTYDTQMQANRFLDKLLNISIGILQIDNATRKSVVIDRTEGRMSEGYSPEYNRICREIAYPFRAKYNNFTGTNTTKYFVTFDSLQDTDSFEEIAESFHVINLAVLLEKDS